MRPSTWHPPVGLSSLEQTIIARIKRAKLFIFLRDHRHELFDDAFQEELATLYPLSSRGHPPLPPAQLALATIIQTYTGVSDDEVRERDAHGSALTIGAQLSGYRASTVQHRNIWGGVPDELPVLPVCNDKRTKQENHTWLPDIPLPRVPPYLQ